MNLLPARIEFTAFGASYAVLLAGAYSDAPRGEKVLRLRAGETLACLAEADGELRVYGPARGCAAHLLLLQGFARRKAQTLLGARILEFSERIGATPFAFRVGDQRKRWGSCSQGAGRLPKICLNWRALLLKAPLLEQLCLHELCHLREMNHSPAFHQLMLAVNPQARRDERELGRAFAALPRWAVHASHFISGRKTG